MKGVGEIAKAKQTIRASHSSNSSLRIASLVWTNFTSPWMKRIRRRWAVLPASRPSQYSWYRRSWSVVQSAGTPKNASGWLPSV